MYKKTINGIGYFRLSDGAWIGPENQEIVAWLAEGNTPEPYVAPPPPIPDTVSRFQARAALAQAGHFDAVDSMLSNLPKTDIRRMAWEDASSFNRTSTTLQAMVQMLGLSDAELDALFVLAASIEA